MLMSVAYAVSAWSGVIPPSAGDDVMLNNMQTYIKHKSQQEAGQPGRFMILLVYFFALPILLSVLF